MKLIDKKSGIVVADIVTNHGMTVDEMLELVDAGIDDDGQIYTSVITNDDGNYEPLNYINAYYENLEIVP